MNNAGVYEFAPLEGITLEHIQKHFDLNVTGLLLTTQAAVKLMGPEGGAIVNDWFDCGSDARAASSRLQ